MTPEQQQAELAQAAANRETEASSFDNAVNVFAKEEPPDTPEPPRPPEPAVEGDEPETPQPEPPPSEEKPEDKPAEQEAKSPALVALEKELLELKRESKKERQRADYWMQNFQQQVAPKPEPPKPVVSAAPPPRPKLSQFETTDQWEEAVFNWIEDQTKQVKQEIFQQQAQQQTERQQQEAQQKYTSFLDAKISEGQKKFGQTQFDKVCNDLVEDGIVTYGSNMHTTLFNLDRYPDVVMELGKNMAEAQRIANLPPQKQIYELEALERRIIAKEELARKAQTKIPTKVEAPGAGEDAKQSPSVAKFRQAAKASGGLRDWGKVFQADQSL